MNPLEKLVVYGSVLLLMSFSVLYLLRHPATIRADDNQEIAPYKFADLPHGRIYKAVHEGCELFIVENDFLPEHGVVTQHQYSISTGRGCR